MSFSCPKLVHSFRFKASSKKKLATCIYLQQSKSRVQNYACTSGFCFAMLRAWISSHLRQREPVLLSQKECDPKRVLNVSSPTEVSRTTQHSPASVLYGLQWSLEATWYFWNSSLFRPWFCQNSILYLTKSIHVSICRIRIKTLHEDLRILYLSIAFWKTWVTAF